MFKTTDGKLVKTLYAAASQGRWDYAPEGTYKVEARSRDGIFAGQTMVVISANKLAKTIIAVAPTQTKWETNTDRPGMNLPPHKVYDW